MTTKDAVRDVWNEAACGEMLQPPPLDNGTRAKSAERDRLKSSVLFADSANSERFDVLEIDLALVADREQFAPGGHFHRFNLTPHAVEVTGRRLRLHRLVSDWRAGDAESLPFAYEGFHVVAEGMGLQCRNVGLRNDENVSSGI